MPKDFISLAANTQKAPLPAPGYKTRSGKRRPPATGVVPTMRGETDPRRRSTHRPCAAPAAQGGFCAALDVGVAATERGTVPREGEEEDLQKRRARTAFPHANARPRQGHAHRPVCTAAPGAPLQRPRTAPLPPRAPARGRRGELPSPSAAAGLPVPRHPLRQEGALWCKKTFETERQFM